MKKSLVFVFCVLLALSLLSCTASPTAVKVGDSKVDASEYAYYLNYNRLNFGPLSAESAVLSGEELLARAREQTLKHITSAELVRMKCRELGLEISGEDKAQLKEEKDELIESFGGMAGYLEYLKSNMLTDRLYDKLRENSVYYSMLYEAVTAPEGGEEVSDAELLRFFGDNYISVSFINMPPDIGPEEQEDSESEPMPPAPEPIGAPETSLPGDEPSGEEPEGGDAVPDEAGIFAGTQLDFMSQLLEEITAGQMTFEQAMELYGGTSEVLNTLDDRSRPYIADALELSENELGGVFTYPDGYYLILRTPLDMSYFYSHREQIEISASDKRFNDYIDEAAESVEVTAMNVCRKISFENLSEYIK